MRLTCPSLLPTLGTLPTGIGGLLCAVVQCSALSAQDVPDPERLWAWADFEPTVEFPANRTEEMLEVGNTLWLRTDRSVHWFDGFRWRRVTVEAGLPEGPVTGIASDGAGGVLVVASGRVYSGDTEEFDPLDLPEEFYAERSALRAVEVGRGGILISSRPKRGSGGSSSVFRYSSGRLDEVSPGGLAWPRSLWTDGVGGAYVDAVRGILRWDGTAWALVLEHPYSRHLATAFAATRENRIRMAVGDFLEGWSLIDPMGRAPPVSVVGNDRVLSMATLADDIVAVFENGEIRRYGEGGWSTFPMPDLRRNGVHFVYSDRGGDLWFASASGVHLLRGGVDRWTSIEYEGPDPRNRINAILTRPGGDLWVGTHAGLLHYSFDVLLETIRTVDGRRLGPVTGVSADSTGGIWVVGGAQYDGVARFSGGRWTHFGPEQGYTGGPAHRVFTSADGTVWVAALGSSDQGQAGSGFFRFDGEAWERVEGPEEVLGARGYSFTEGIDGAFWFGTSAGLARLRDGTWTTWSTTNDGPRRSATDDGNRLVYALEAEADGGVWFSSGATAQVGLGRVLPSDSIVRYYEEDGLPSDAVKEMRRAPDGDLWVSSGSGIARRVGDEWAVFDGTSGLDPVNTWPLAFNVGGVLIGTTRGIRRLDLSEEAYPAPQLALVGPVAIEGPVVRLQWDARSYRGSQDPGQIETRYAIDGGAWSEWSVGRELWTSTDALGSAGPHLVEVQAKGLHGGLSDPIEAAISIPYPLVQRLSFYGPVGLMTLLILGVFAQANRRRKRDAEELRASEQRFRTLVDSAPDAIAIYDARDGHFVSANRRAELLMRMKWSEGAAPTLADIALTDESDPGTSLAAMRMHIEAALAGDFPVFEWTVRGPGGPIPAEIRLARLDAADQDLVRFSVFDVTERKEAETQRTELEERLGQAQRIEAIGKLTGGVAHDFNNLLTVIAGNLELLLDSTEDEEVRELAESALEAADRSGLLTARLLAFSRRQTLEAQPVDVRELVTGLLDLLERSLGETVEIETSFEERLPAALVDSAQLENALVNLAVNARDAMPLGGTLRIEVASTTVVVGGTRSSEVEPGTYVSIRVTDTGTGMPEETLARAFDPFYTTKEVGKGSGLGLSMVYGFVRQSGGMVELDTRMGSGTTVSLLLPVAEGTAERSDDHPHYRSLPHGRGEHLLVVEDEPRVLDFTRRLCERLGYSVEVATTAREGLHIIESGRKIDLIFSDVVLPGGMNGVELAIKARTLRPEIPVLLTSGYAEQPVLDLARSLPDVGLLPKPFDTMTLAERLRSALEAR